MSKKRDKRNNKNQSHPATSNQPNLCDIKWPSVYPVRIEPSSDAEIRYADEQNYRRSQLGIAYILNWITGTGTAVALLGLLYLYGTLRTAQQAAGTAASQLGVMQGQLDQMVADKRPWLEVIPEIDRRIFFSRFYNRPHVHIPIKCNVANYGESPARNVLCNIRIDSVPYVFDERVKADNDTRLKTLCDDTITWAKNGPDSGIPVFQNKISVPLHQMAENIDQRYFKIESTIYIVQGCADYTYASDKHGQTTFRYLVGKFGPDKTLHGIPFIEGKIEEKASGSLSRAYLDAKDVDFVKTEGGNYAR